MVWGGLLRSDGNVVAIGTLPTTVYTWRHKLAGVVRVNGVPARRRVLVFDRYDLSYRGSAWSDPATGEWKIEGMAEVLARSLTVLVFDDLQREIEFNAEVLDQVSQVATI